MPPLPALARYEAAPETKANLDYADLPVIDLAEFSTQQSRLKSAQKVRQAMNDQGFFYVVNAGLTKEETQRMFDIADLAFTGVGPEEKKFYEARIKENGSFQGYKPRQFWHIDNGVRDQLEHYNINRDVTKRQHPDALRPFIPEIETFARHNHLHVLHRVLRLLALGLELPENTLVDMHGLLARGETYVRFMKYFPRTQQDEIKTKNVWLKGHTDFGTITILYSQPVAALQILAKDGTWKWVRHVENALIINAGDALEFMTGGYYRATIHRVIQPPPDQQNLTRLGVFYFCMTDDDVVLKPLSNSPVLQRVGITRRCADDQAPTMEAWRKARTAAYGQTTLKPAVDECVEEEVINGVTVKHYN